jgi:hypothetical protein
MHHPPAESNICVEYVNAVKPAIVRDYNRHMGYVDKSDCMTNSYSISKHTVILSPSGSFNSEQFYSHFLWFRIFLRKFQVCLGQGSNTRGGKVC